MSQTLGYQLVYTYTFKLDSEASKFVSKYKSRSKTLLEPTSIKQWGYSFLINETMEAFDGTRTNNTTVYDYETFYPLHQAVRISSQT